VHHLLVVVVVVGCPPGHRSVDRTVDRTVAVRLADERLPLASTPALPAVMRTDDHETIIAAVLAAHGAFVGNA
jgi:hypothetical protein